MKSLLFICHEFHKTTKSSDFIQEILKQKFEIKVVYFDPYKNDFNIFNELKGEEFDILVLWQIMPSLDKLQNFIKFKKTAFFPMYDNTKTLNSSLWNEYKECNIINFSKTFHEVCKKGGLSSFYIQYFPEPAEITDIGGENDIFFWQRTSKITTQTLEKLLCPQKIKNLYLHIKTDPKNKFIKPSKLWNGKITETSWFETKDEMKAYIQKSAIYFAPRKYEGIGMSFLEAMAAGRCVIAPDYPTMNEYITHGVNGYLYNLKNPQKIDISDVRIIQKNAEEYIKNGYENWEKEKFNIIKYIETEPVTDKKLLDENIFIKNEKTLLFGFIPAKIKQTTKFTVYELFYALPLRFNNPEPKQS